MIQDGFSFIAFLMFFSGLVIWYENKYKDGRFFKYVPAVIIIYFSAMVMSTLGVWEMTDSVKQARGEVRNAILPAMIFLMLLRADLRDIVKLGPKLLGTFFAATLSIVLGFIVSFALFQNYLNDNAALTFGALAGSWIGGTQNMVAVQQALGLNDAGMGYTLLIDSIDYAMWIMFLLALVPFAHKFNDWTKADTSTLDDLQEKLTLSNDQIRKETTFPDMMLLLGCAFGLSALANYASGLLPQNAVLTSTTWSIMIVTLVGVVCAMTPLGKIPGSPQLSNVLLYTLVALIAANANFAELTQAPAYILAGFVILLIHGLILTTIAKIFKLDLFTCGIASLANIGGVASSPVLAAAYSQTLVPVAILMALMGVIIGTGGGIGVALLLQAM
ncbi:DUF819 domain-containing protein [Pseudoalteromonas luteoviolacea]|uniref:DUF819 family protein n=1 Tax=Pseudoalteromonas luteoviolacea TaxID=43657 RepID=UPI001B37F3A9|nr:DUF819 family protein [Pseudoalteromonas luteoviolacea]MBQ4810118.1 DUF819 domain-containing protein [Pseudoalteromonas luteoviolacea]